MKVTKVTFIVFVFWISTFAGSFICARLSSFSGVGFTRGLNRISIWMQWQGMSFLIALLLATLAITSLKRNRKWKRIALVPITCHSVLLIWIGGVFAYSNFARPSSNSHADLNLQTKSVTPTAVVSNSDPTPTSEAIISRYIGFYRGGFEASHFYSSDGSGVWWVGIIRIRMGNA